MGFVERWRNVKVLGHKLTAKEAGASNVSAGASASTTRTQCKLSGGSSICEHLRESSKRKQFGGFEEHQRAQPPKITTAASRISKDCWRKKKAACLVVLPSRRERSSSCQWSRLCARPCHYALDYLIHYLLNPFASWTQKRCFVRGFLPVGY